MVRLQPISARALRDGAGRATNGGARRGGARRGAGGARNGGGGRGQDGGSGVGGARAAGRAVTGRRDRDKERDWGLGERWGAAAEGRPLNLGGRGRRRLGGAERGAGARPGSPARRRGGGTRPPAPLPQFYRSGRRERPVLPAGKDPARAGQGPEVTEPPRSSSRPASSADFVALKVSRPLSPLPAPPLNPPSSGDTCGRDRPGQVGIPDLPP